MKIPTKLLILLSVVCIVSSVVSAQPAQQSALAANPCSMTLSAAPQVWGFSLGMTVEEVRERYPSLRVTASTFGQVVGHVNANDEKAQRNYEWQLLGVYMVILKFVDTKLASIATLYEPGSFTYSSLDAFTAMLSQAYRLPKTSWVSISNGGSPYKEMNCGELYFLATTDTGGTAFAVSDLKTMNAYQERVKNYRSDAFRSNR